MVVASIIKVSYMPPNSNLDPLDFIEHTECIRVDMIDRSPYQSRISVDPEHIAALASSIKDHDLSSQILVRPKESGRYELICGENRLEAHKLLGRPSIRAVVRSLSDIDAAKSLAADNLQRKELSDYEVCKTLFMLLDNGFARTDTDLATIIGRPRSYVTKVKAFTALPEQALQSVIKAPELFGASMVAELKASGYAKTHPGLVEEAFERIVSGALTQAGAITYIRNKVKPVESSALKDVTFKVKNKTVRMTVYQDTIRISCKGMDSLGIEEKLQNCVFCSNRPP